MSDLNPGFHSRSWHLWRFWAAVSWYEGGGVLLDVACQRAYLVTFRMHGGWRRPWSTRLVSVWLSGRWHWRAKYLRGAA